MPDVELIAEVVDPDHRLGWHRQLTRFWDRVDLAGQCWLWTGNQDHYGYGAFYASGKVVKAHRFAYESLIGPIPEGLVLDHLCRVRLCVNPAHLDPVTWQENVRRGDWTGNRTHCVRGHPFDEANTYVYASGKRKCRRCAADRQARYNRKASR